MSVFRAISWTPDEADLVGIDPVKARELIEKCFFEAQRETFAAVKQRVGTPGDDAAIHRSVNAVIRGAMADTGGDYDDPTRDDLYRALGILAEHAASWGTPTDILEHHKAQIGRILEMLAD